MSEKLKASGMERKATDKRFDTHAKRDIFQSTKKGLKTSNLLFTVVGHTNRESW